MRRDEVWWARLSEPAGRRPLVLLSRDEAYKVRDLITVAPVTSRMPGIPTEVRLGAEDELPKACVVNLDTITTIPKQALIDRITTLSPAKLLAVEEALRFALGLSEARFVR